MTAVECAEILRNYIRYRERMNQNLFAVEPDGKEVRIDHPNDILLKALKFALAAVEEKLQ